MTVRLGPVLCAALALSVAGLARRASSLSREIEDLRACCVLLADPPVVSAAPHVEALASTSSPVAEPAVRAVANEAAATGPGGPAPREVILDAQAVALNVGSISLGAADQPVGIVVFGSIEITLDSLIEVLDLTWRQRSAVERIVVDARAALLALRQLPDGTGRTWETVQRDAVRWDNGVRTIDDTEAIAFRNLTIPDREETFGEAERRLLDEAGERLREGLDAEQRQCLDRISTGALFGPLPPVPVIVPRIRTFSAPGSQ